MIGRRNLLAGAAAMAAPPLRAQPAPDLPRLALVEQARPVELMVEGGAVTWDAFLRELRALGHVEGQTVTIDRWTAGGQDDAGFARLAEAVVASAPDVIVAEGSRAVIALTNATPTLPIVATAALQPFVVSLAHPGRNLTGVDGSAGSEIFMKQVALLHEAVPFAARLAWVGPQDTWERSGQVTRRAAEELALSLVPTMVAPPTSEASIRAAFASIVARDFDALVISPAPDMPGFSAVVADLAIAAGLPTIAFQRDYADAGALMAYGPDFPDIFRRLAAYVDRVLHGADPAEMAIEQSSRFTFVVNLRTAAALGIALPPEIMVLRRSSSNDRPPCRFARLRRCGDGVVGHGP